MWILLLIVYQGAVQNKTGWVANSAGYNQSSDIIDEQVCSGCKVQDNIHQQGKVKSTQVIQTKSHDNHVLFTRVPKKLCFYGIIVKSSYFIILQEQTWTIQ